ncbi:MAG TPA: hypothetical protein VLA12_22655, partial [Planctomycetaceae bacterium]|nr:hypothetical protein [Planctomycetaceae bacterium]
MSSYKKTFKRATVCVCLLLQFATQLLAQSGTAEVRPGDIAGRATAENAPANAPIDPQLAQILKTWENKTSGITKLSGTHRRFVYDFVFEVEKRADGKFYYESPDKGRIDIEVVEIGEKEQSQKLGRSG